MKKIMLVMMMCLMLVGCGSKSIIEKVELIEEETFELFEGAGTINGGRFHVYLTSDSNDIENLYDVIRPIDKEICDKVDIDRYDSVMIDIYDKDDNVLGSMDIENIGNGIMYDLYPNKLGEMVKDVKVE